MKHADTKEINDKFTDVIQLGTLKGNEFRAQEKILQKYFPEDLEDSTSEDELCHV